ncbi:hypothetical protein HI914_00617 [Erysiphe necator]|uniref:Putative u4 tri-snrnp-associated protein n=1 Tax=Uncinula necator TaxID=52586 RepID=A0A0B1P1I3_UNCNE|nr:hypothetical protein HI914_00617 [Erysiphe necator]KHJ30761.1 putative u4 tri-snrnp-associated protein [Erysiphe necator]
MGETRSNRSDGRSKWSDRRPSSHFRERDVFRDRYESRDRERDRRYRSRSPQDNRYAKSSWKDDRDDRSRNRDRRRDYRDDRSERTRYKDSGVGYRDSRGSQHHEKNSPNEREKDKKRDSKSRTPELDQFAKTHRARVSNGSEAVDTADQISTPPVSFKVGPTQDFDQMDIDGDNSKKIKNSRSAKNKAAEPQEEEEILVEEDGLSMMKTMMGFSNFGTTHQKKVPGNNVSAVRKEKKTEYRQYMNRVGGFNRPLSPSHPSR